MSIEVSRIVRDINGNIIREDTFTSEYDAQDEIIEVGPNTEISISSHEESEDESESEGENADEAEDEVAEDDGEFDSAEAEE
jgi:hypothetical protein